MAKSLAAILKDASAALDRFDFGSALQLYQQALGAEPNNAAAAMGLAMVLNRTGQPANALSLLRQIWAGMSASKAQLTPVQRASVLAQIGLAQEQLGSLGDALEAYRQAARLVLSDELTQRIKQLEPIAGSPAPVQQLVLSARRQLANRQADEAAKTYRAALQLQPDNAEVLHGLALVLRELKQTTEAMTLLQKAVILSPHRADYYNDLGLLFHDRNDFVKAVSFHKRALKVDPRLVSAWINLGVANKRLGRLDESEAAYRSALEIDSRSAAVQNNLGNLLRVKGELAEARKHLRKAIELQPGYQDARANLDAVEAALKERKIAQVKATETPPAKASKKSPAKTPARKVAPAKAAAAKLASVKPASVKPAPVNAEIKKTKAAASSGRAAR
jgi:tetratricopeptide (TPR) repeat protein